jgi:hypothetical protein
MKGRIERRAMELGVMPRQMGKTIEMARQIKDFMDKNPGARVAGATPLSQLRLVQAMRKIDPDLAHMIESLAPVYLVKK